MQMGSSRGEEGAAWKNLENHGKRATHAWFVGVFDPQKGRGEEDSRDAAREKQEGIQGQWQQESFFREILEQTRRNEDTGCSSEVMRKGFVATRDSMWYDFNEECRVKGMSSECPKEQCVKLTRRW